MNKLINRAKLKAMGLERVKQVCMRHADRAIGHRGNHDERKTSLHCDLLDQCAAVGRELIKEQNNEQVSTSGVGERGRAKATIDSLVGPPGT